MSSRLSRLVQKGSRTEAVFACRNVFATSRSLRFSSRSSTPCARTAAAADELEQLSEEPRPVGYPWRTVSAICVQRFPMLVKEKTPLELEFLAMQERQSMEQSRLSDFELEERSHLEKKLARQKKALEEDVDASQLAEEDTEFEELLEARENELNSFKPASRVTQADNSGDHKTVHRKLSHMLYLLVKKPRIEQSWQMPQGGLEEGENLLEAAERELQEECGENLKVHFLSNSPSAFFSYKHPALPGSPPGMVGSKVFFFKAQYIAGEVEINKEELENYAWVTKEEMRNYVSEDYYSAISQSLAE